MSASPECVNLISDEEDSSGHEDDHRQQNVRPVFLNLQLNLKITADGRPECESSSSSESGERITASPEKVCTAKKSTSKRSDPKSVRYLIPLDGVPIHRFIKQETLIRQPHVKRENTADQSAWRTSGSSGGQNNRTSSSTKSAHNVVKSESSPPSSVKSASPSITPVKSEQTSRSSGQSAAGPSAFYSNRSQSGQSSVSKTGHRIGPASQTRRKEVEQDQRHVSQVVRKEVPDWRPKRLSWSELKDYIHSESGRITFKNARMPIAQIKDICQKRGWDFDPDEIQYEMALPKRLLSQSQRDRQEKLGQNADYNVVRLKDFRVTERGTIRFLVEWRDAVGCDTWQPADHLTGTTAMREYEQYLRDTFQLQEEESAVRIRHFKKLVLKEEEKQENADVPFLRRLVPNSLFDKVKGNPIRLLEYISDRYHVWLTDQFRQKHDSEGSIDEDSSDSDSDECGVLQNTTLEVILLSVVNCKYLDELLDFKDRRKAAEPHLQEFNLWINQQIHGEQDFRRVTVVNEVDDAVPEKFEYVSDYVSSTTVDWEEGPLHSCMENCICADTQDEDDDDENQQNSCPCLVGLTPIQYRHKKLKGRVVKTHQQIYECNAECHCVQSGRCTQKVATAKSEVKLEIFRKVTGDWGIRTKEEIPAKRFVMRFTGQLMTRDHVMRKYDNDTDRISDNVHLISLDQPHLIPDLVHYVDGSEMSNLCRYVNHSCDPNLMSRSVFSGNYNAYIPRVAFYANRKIAAGEELTIDLQVGKEIDADAVFYEDVSLEDDFFGFYGNPENRLNPPALTKEQMIKKLTRPQKKCNCGSENCRIFLI
jgi:hypothetical protein